MHDLILKNYLFSSGEFMVLASCVGMEEIPMFLKKISKKVEEKELNLVLFGLFQKGMLFWESEGVYRLDPEISEIFQEIKDAQKTAQISFRSQGRHLLCFVGRNIIVTEMSGNDDSVVKVSKWSRKEFLCELADMENEQEDIDVLLIGEKQNISSVKIDEFSLGNLKKFLTLQIYGEEVHEK